MLAEEVVRMSGSESQVVRNICTNIARQTIWDDKQGAEIYVLDDGSCVRIVKGMCNFATSTKLLVDEY